MTKTRAKTNGKVGLQSIQIRHNLPNDKEFFQLQWTSALSIDETIDLLGDIKGAQKQLEKIAGHLKERIKSLVDIDSEHDTGVWLAQHFSQERSYVPAQTIRDELGDEWVEAHSETTQYSQLKISKSIANGGK